MGRSNPNWCSGDGVKETRVVGLDDDTIEESSERLIGAPSFLFFCHIVRLRQWVFFKDLLFSFNSISPWKLTWGPRCFVNKCYLTKGNFKKKPQDWRNSKCFLRMTSLRSTFALRITVNKALICKRPHIFLLQCCWDAATVVLIFIRLSRV